MPAFSLSQIFSFEGRVGRRSYFFAGALLTALKYAVDTFIASRFGQPWHIWNYFVPHSGPLFDNTPPQAKLYFILWAVAIPFFWVGIALTLKRLRDAGQRTGWVFLFFVPVVNLAFFLYLSVAPTASVTERAYTLEQDAEQTLPSSRAPLVGVLIAVVLGFGLVWLSASHLGQYAWGLFLGVPFVVGFVASWFYNADRLHTRWQTAGVCTVTVLLIGWALIGFRLEGLVCLVMALPLALPFAIAGGLAAHRCLDHRRITLTPPRVTAGVTLLPLLMFAEHAANLIPPTRPVVTSITVHAPVAVVWRNVIAFPPLAPPQEFLFRSGIAYPIGAVIEGTGVGAVRRCRFSTGDFVEPITTWDEDHLLAFKVTGEPSSLNEIGFGPIHTPHNDGNYMRSQHGQFRLVALDADHTLLEGTTWYQDYFWPQVYWRAVSDAIVHHIHTRVLEHVKQQAEAQYRASS
jgi:uncharacterized membrane protein YhaH (DUF805 family)